MSVHPRRTGSFAAWSANHRGLWIPLALTALASLIYAALIPPFEGPDAGAHLGYAAYLASHHADPLLTAESAAISHQLVQQPPLYYRLVSFLAPAAALSETLTLDVPNPQWPEHSPRATLTLPGTPAAAWQPARAAIWLSLIGALLTVAATYGLVRRLVPKPPELAMAAAAVVGLNPQFLFSSASITNDTWAAGTSAAAVCLAAWAASRRASRSRWLGWAASGALLGLAAMTKYSGLVTLAPIGLLGLFGWVRRRSRPEEGALSVTDAVVSAVTFAGGFVLVAGRWYGHNLAAYGAAVPIREMHALLGDLAREEPESWPAVLREASWLPHSFWGVFGYGVVAPPNYEDLVDLLMGAAGLGLAVGLARWLLGPRRGPNSGVTGAENGLSSGGGQAAILGLAWLGAQVVSVLFWMRQVHFGNQGRLLFPAAPAAALLLVIGWSRLVPEMYRAALSRVAVGLMLGLALWQMAVLHGAYAMPGRVAAASFDRPIQARFAAGMTLLGADFPRGTEARRGGILPVTLYWTTSHPITESYRLFVHLAGPDDHLYARFDGVPYAGRHDTRQWVPGEVFADRYELRVEPAVPPDAAVTGAHRAADAAAAPPIKALLSAGFTNLDDGERLPLVGPDEQVMRRPDGEPAAERAELGEIRLGGVP